MGAPPHAFTRNISLETTPWWWLMTRWLWLAWMKLEAPPGRPSLQLSGWCVIHWFMKIQWAVKNYGEFRMVLSLWCGGGYNWNRIVIVTDQDHAIVHLSSEYIASIIIINSPHNWIQLSEWVLLWILTRILFVRDRGDHYANEVNINFNKY